MKNYLQGNFWFRNPRDQKLEISRYAVFQVRIPQENSSEEEFIIGLTHCNGAEWRHVRRLSVNGEQWLHFLGKWLPRAVRYSTLIDLVDGVYIMEIVLRLPPVNLRCL